MRGSRVRLAPFLPSYLPFLVVVVLTHVDIRADGVIQALRGDHLGRWQVEGGAGGVRHSGMPTGGLQEGRRVLAEQVV